MEFTNEEGIVVLYDLIKKIQENKQYLSEIDGAIGDGDHGINMSKGFTIAEEKLNKDKFNMSEGFMVLSKALMEKVGGSMGPLYGKFFLGMSIASKGKENIDQDVIKEMLDKAYVGITSISQAKIGDKSLIDVLEPAIKAYAEKTTLGEGVVPSLEYMKEVSEQGMISTIDMVAKIGRASRLGERSRGHQDAGATSCNIILQSFATSIIKLLDRDKEKESQYAKNYQ
ncbi:MAG: dihydroxyacetone kinase subunit L [Clostridia bacterium]|nr:dihydroxyacetone kinase subunit L [Clostridia bacterium]